MKTQTELFKERTEPKPKAQYVAQIHFDGGCSPNPGAKYGSFRIEIDGLFQINRSRFQLGYGTNNEAEFEALLEALRALGNGCYASGINSKLVSVRLFTDSTIVRNWLQRFNAAKVLKIKNDRKRVMAEYASRCLQELAKFKDFEIKWNSRDVNVEILGH